MIYTDTTYGMLIFILLGVIGYLDYKLTQLRWKLIHIRIVLKQYGIEEGE